MHFSNFKLFSSDIDGTLLGQPDALGIFKRGWSQLDEQVRPLLCYNTGRLKDDTLQLIQSGVLPEPDYIISGVGTSIYDYRNAHTIKEFSEILEEGWDLERVKDTMRAVDAEVSLQPVHFQNAYKSSWFFRDASDEQIEAIGAALLENDLDVHVVYSSSLHLDVIPKWANKGNALKWLLRHLAIRPEQALVAGDSGNDSAMFLISGIHGIVVGNAQPELFEATRHLPLFFAEREMIAADAVIRGLEYYNVFSRDHLAKYDTPTPHSEFTDLEADLIETIRLSDGEVKGLSSDQLALIREGYQRAIVAIEKNITSMGFSACSLDDNETRGTDENYRSVWGRDGAITVIGTMPLVKSHPHIRECQKKTLTTLLDHISPTGQIPANVRIEDSVPDYSGVGGICAIDSGLWLIIAFYEYIRTTRELSLLRNYVDVLQRAMDWLSAHDSNNDALLEIPEAGDWTDLFGRSYNVLYDEVLWYRANICFGRLLGLMGNEARAGDYLRWARIIKREIHANFWPSTQERLYSNISFAEQQYALGDARYLIAQVTPFDYSWRCDTYGNVLAYLYNVVDSEKAGLAFRFMWGSGINDPYPMANLYPVVTEGDKEWRPYYTVNLLNLPHHYHNGGIWPFLGGAWVRFIHKLGLRDVALQELYRLTELNKSGVHHEWEFNEWAHGKTGRPMGKAYQAWSAAEFITACHQLKVVNGNQE